MKNTKYLYLAIVAIILLFTSTVSFAQGTTRTDKKDLINKFRVLTGANEVRLGTSISTEGLYDDISEMVTNDAELSEAQKADINKSIIEAKARVEKMGKDFFADQNKITAVSEEVIFNIYDKEFTVEELQEAISFYSTPVGKKLAHFLPTLSQNVQDAFGKVIIKQFQDYLRPTTDSEYQMQKKKIADAKATK